MRFKIHLSTTSPRRFLPFDYQYAMASAVYKIIAKGDEAYSRFLHDDGFPAGRLKRFKMFTFSSLELPRYTPWNDKGLLELHGPSVSFTVSFMADKAAEAFVKGMFADQRMDIGDRFHTLQLQVTSVEAMPAPFFQRTMRYRCASPMTVELREPGRKYETYLPPDDPRFEECLAQNLIAKCAALNLLHTGDDSEESKVQFSLDGRFHSKLHTIKPFTPMETKVRGFLFDFTLTAPEHVHEVGYYAGFGMNNAMGFGSTITKI